MPIPLDKAVVGQTYRVTRPNGDTWRGTVDTKTPLSIIFTVFPEDRAVAGGNHVSLSPQMPGTTLTLSRVSPTAVSKIAHADNLNLPEDIERLLKRYGGKSRRNRKSLRKRTTKRKTI